MNYQDLLKALNMQVIRGTRNGYKYKVICDKARNIYELTISNAQRIIYSDIHYSIGYVITTLKAYTAKA